MNKVLVIDFGSQYCKLIARKIRELGVYSVIVSARNKQILTEAQKYQAIVLSGGPNSVFDKNSLRIDRKIFSLGIPILGTCYGMQLIHQTLGGEVEKLQNGEFGKVKLLLANSAAIVNDINDQSIVWMSHHDTVTKLAPNFEVIAKTKIGPAITANLQKQIYTFQFHAEVQHTELGNQFLSNFLTIAKLERNWKPTNILEEKIAKLSQQLQTNKVILGVSGGVDSTVVAALIAKVAPKNLLPIFIDNGLLRTDEASKVKSFFKQSLNLDVKVVEAQKLFYQQLQNCINPEQKRKIIGRNFIELFEKEKSKYQGKIKFLAQGTIYPDVIESAQGNENAQVIKSHHNVGGLPEKFDFQLLEPLRDLFKDEVRKLGTALKLPEELVNRHPFPGPGLAIRIIGEVTAKKINILQRVDQIMTDFLFDKNWYYQISQAAAILTNLQTVGVQGDQRTYGYLVAIRFVKTTDFMTANIANIHPHLLEELSTQIINHVHEVNRVVYDITSKPPATIEWE